MIRVPVGQLVGTHKAKQGNKIVLINLRFLSGGHKTRLSLIHTISRSTHKTQTEIGETADTVKHKSFRIIENLSEVFGSIKSEI